MVSRVSAALGRALGLGAVVLTGCFPTERPVAGNLTCEGDSCACLPNFGNCDGSPHNGCEADLRFDARHCGSCDIRCTNGQCVEGSCRAADGYVDCNESLTDGFEARIDSDPRNCGACGHDCLGGTCNQGQCQPYRPVDPGFWILGLGSDDTHVFFCDNFSGAVLRAPQVGGALEVLAFDQKCSGNLEVGGSSLFWSIWPHELPTAPELLFEVPTSGTGVSLVATADYLDLLAARDDVVAWVDIMDLGGGSWERRVRVRAGASSPVTDIYSTSDDYIDSIAIYGDTVYWGQGPVTLDARASVYSASTTGGLPVELATATEDIVRFLQARADYLYWVEDHTAGALKDFQIVRLAATGGAVESLYEVSLGIGELIVDDMGMYWTEDEGQRLMAWSHGASEPVVLADYQEISDLTAGPTALFWYDDPGKLLALAK